MVLNVHSDASYLIEPKARSRAGGHFYMSSNSTHSKDNGAVLNIAKIMKQILTSAAEAEIGALFLNSRQAIPARRLLEEMGHKQPPTPIQTDNTTAFGFVNKIMVPKATKSTDMRYWYMRDQSDQENFRYYWGKGKRNCADYWTKHFSAAHHKEKRPTILTKPAEVALLRLSQGLSPHQYRTNSRVC